MVYEVGVDALDSLEASSAIKTFTFQRGYAFLMLLNTHKPYLADPGIRRALNEAIDRQALVTEVFRGHGTPAAGPVWPQHWAYSADLPQFGFRPKSLPPQAHLRLKCLFIDRSHERLALLMQQQLRAIGVELELEAMSTEEGLGRLERGDFDAFLADYRQGPNLARPYLNWHTGAPNNYGRYSNAARRRRARPHPSRRRRPGLSGRGGVPFSARSSTIPRPSSSRGVNGREPSARASRSRPSRTPMCCAASIAGGRSPVPRRRRGRTDDRWRSRSAGSDSNSRCCWPAPPCCRCWPTASSRCSRSSAARAIRSSPATRTSPPAPPRRSGATSRPTPSSSRRSPPTCRTPDCSRGSRSASCRNYVLSFREFREITLFDESGRPLASSRVGAPRVGIPTDSPLLIDGVAMSPIRIDQDLLPTSIFAIHLTRLNQPAGWLVGEFSLEEMWRMVDRIRIGEHGFALVVAPDGALDRPRRSRQESAGRARRATCRTIRWCNGSGRASGDTPVADEYDDDGGRSQLGVATRIAPLGWTVIVEQPTAEAYASATAAPAAAGRGHRRRAARHDRGRLFLRPPVHHADSRAAARHPGDCRRRSRPPA